MIFNRCMLLLGIAMLMLNGCGDPTTKPDEKTTTSTYAGPPYTVQFEESVNPSLPGLHSYIHATYMDKLILIGGRTNGMHQDYNFDQTYANPNIYVISTNNWSDPTTWTVNSMKYSNIRGVVNKQFRANNAQYFQENDVLYIVGGLDYANVPTKVKSRQGGVLLELLKSKVTQDGEPAHGPVTQPFMTAVNLADLVDAVMGNKPLMPPSVRQVMDTSLAITGGELEMMGDSVYLVFGWDFTQIGEVNKSAYSHQIRSFTYQDNGTDLSISDINVCSTCWDGVSAPTDSDTSGIFRRRDGSLSAFWNPVTDTEALLFYSGVFKGGNTNFSTPVLIEPGKSAEQQFEMRWNVYTCQVIPAYSKSKDESYGTLLGGMTPGSFTGGAISVPTELTASNTNIYGVQNGFGVIPLTNGVSTMRMKADGSFSQFLNPDSFPPIASPLILPAVDTIPADTLPAGSVTWNGSESEIFWTVDPSFMYSNGVLDYDKFIAANPNGGTVAYLHGGIEAAQNSVFGLGDMTLHLSVASNRIWAIKVVPVKAQ